MLNFFQLSFRISLQRFSLSPLSTSLCFQFLSRRLCCISSLRPSLLHFYALAHQTSCHCHGCLCISSYFVCSRRTLLSFPLAFFFLPFFLPFFALSYPPYTFSSRSSFYFYGRDCFSSSITSSHKDSGLHFFLKFFFLCYSRRRYFLFFFIFNTFICSPCCESFTFCSSPRLTCLGLACLFPVSSFYLVCHRVLRFFSLFLPTLRACNTFRFPKSIP